ncbi:MAG: hypothetical protein V4611_01255 [Patescibacteria group bacterium]
MAQVTSSQRTFNYLHRIPEGLRPLSADHRAQTIERVIQHIKPRLQYLGMEELETSVGHQGFFGRVIAEMPEEMQHMRVVPVWTVAPNTQMIVLAKDGTLIYMSCTRFGQEKWLVLDHDHLTVAIERKPIGYTSILDGINRVLKDAEKKLEERLRGLREDSFWMSQLYGDNIVLPRM